MEGLAYTVAREKIRAYLVHKAIEENAGSLKRLPDVETQVKQFFAHDGAIARFKIETRVVTTRDGQERRAGEMLAAMEKAKNGKSTTTSLVALGITHKQSSRWQMEAKLSEPEFESIVESCKAINRFIQCDRWAFPNRLSHNELRYLTLIFLEITCNFATLPALTLVGLPHGKGRFI